MSISTIQLPKNENPTEQQLQNEDDDIYAAFKIVYDGYRRAQERTRAIIKAYNELESITLTLLNDNQENRDVSPKQKKEKTILPTTNVDPDLIDVLMVDLTSDFDFDASVPTGNNLRSPSPIFEAPEKSHKTKKIGEKNFPKIEEKNVLKIGEKNFPKIGELSKSPKLEVTKIHHGIKVENKILDGNEENNALVGNKSENVKNVSKNNDVESLLNESRPCGRLSLSRASYKIEKNKGLGGKISKQSTLVFQPHTSKVDISCSDKMKSKSATHWANLFDDDYRIKKNLNNKQSIAGEEKKDQMENAEKKLENVEKFDKKPEKIGEFVMETPSQINETARSLFEDDDFDDFEMTQNLLENSINAPIAEEKKSSSPNNFGKRRKIDIPIASTPKILEISQRQESIDETFFAPGELNPIKNVVKPMDKKYPVAGCSKMLTPKKSEDKSRFKQKINEKIGKNNEIDDLDLIDTDWDTDISNEIFSPIKRLDNSFDIVPGKTKKSPEYAYKGKTERNKDKRSKLPGWDCWACEKYYGTMNLPPAELKERMNSCSRHKSKYNQRYCTPKDFWNPEFPDTLDSSDLSDNERPTNKN